MPFFALNFFFAQATGYLHHYPHFAENLRLKAKNELFIRDLYKVSHM